MAKQKSKKDKGLQVRVVFLTDEDQRDWLQRLSDSTGAPISHIVRQAVAEYRQRKAV
jgi:hypothetical protein